MTEILYILGYGRSGSTLLSMLLNQHPDVFSGGELINLAPNGWGKNRKCSCGSRAHSCAFWNKVKALWQESSPITDSAVYAELALRFRNYGISPLLRRNPLATLPPNQRDIFLEATRRLYQAISEASGKSIICDASKVPIWARVLQECAGFNVRTIHLVRDGRGVVWSIEKSRLQKVANNTNSAETSRKNILRYSSRWVVSNILCEYMNRKLYQSKEYYRYEDLFSGQDKYINNLMDKLGIPMKDIDPRVIPESQNSHVIAGNKSRTSDRTELKQDLDWNSKFRPLDKLTYCVGTACLGTRYGYSLW